MVKIVSDGCGVNFEHEQNGGGDGSEISSGGGEGHVSVVMWLH